MIRNLGLGGALAALSMASMPTAVCAQEATYNFNIPAQSLGAALRAFGAASRQQIIFDEALVRGRTSNRLVGSYSADRALRILIEGHGLEVHRTAAGVFALRRAVIAENLPLQGEPAQLPEILVTGSTSLNADIRRTQDDVQPYVVFGRDDLEASTATSVEEFLSSRLPMNATRGTELRNDPTSTAGNRSNFNLRGLGSSQTLILINGRRAPGVSNLRSGDLAQPDLNGIPLSAIERIEVLPTTASGIYGGGATGGVINIILRRDYRGLEASATYENTFDTDSGRYRFEVNGGTAIEQGRTQLTFNASIADGNDLLVRDRDYIDRARAMAGRNSPNSFVTNQVIGSRVNIFGVGGADLVLRNGQSLGASYATVPQGYSGGDDGLGLLGGAGQLDLDNPDSPTGGRLGLSSAPNTTSVNASIRREMSSWADLYLDLGYFRNELSSTYSSVPLRMYLSETSPSNPFLGPVFVSIPVVGSEYEAETLSVSESFRNNFGGIFRFGSWRVVADANLSKSVNETRQSPSTLDLIAIRSAIEDGSIQIIRDLMTNPVDLSPYSTDSTLYYAPGDGTSQEYTIRAAGPIWSTAAGPVSLTAMASYRRDEAGSTIASSTYESIAYDYAITQYRYYPARHQDVRSLYSELNVPVFSESQGVPFIHSLDIQASLRYDDYETVSVPAAQNYTLPSPDAPRPEVDYTSSSFSSTDYTLGFKYLPVESLAIRGSFGTGFLPPSLAQISSQQFESPYNYFRDPKRENIPDYYYDQTVRYIYGGNESLEPERSRSLSFGLIYNPQWIEGLRLSADYTRIKKSDEIVNLSMQEIIDFEDDLPGRITRGPNLPGDPAGYAGPIISIDQTLVNIAHSWMEAYDFQVQYEWDSDSLGRFEVFGIATLQERLEAQTLERTAAVDRVGYLNGPLRWRGSIGGRWSRGNLSLFANAQFYDSHLVYGSSDYPSLIAQRVELQGSTSVSSQFNMDVGGRYQFDRGVWDGTELLWGIRNVTGASPKIIASVDTSGGYSTYADPRGRTYSVTLRRRF